MIEIKPIQPHQINAAKRVMAAVCNEIWKFRPTVDELEKEFDEMGEFIDLNNLQATYIENNGIFLVITDGVEVVGTGGIKRLDEEICELKRMWIMQGYRANGWGVKIAHALLHFAKERGYKKVRLELYDPPKQQRAIAFYQELGFYEIEAYRDSPAKLSMEKSL